MDFGALRGAALRAASRVHTRLKGVPVRVLARLGFCIAAWSRLHARAAHAQTAPMYVHSDYQSTKTLRVGSVRQRAVPQHEKTVSDGLVRDAQRNVS